MSRTVVRWSLGLVAASVCAAPVAAVGPAEPPICTDRPTKANATCTVPRGTVQFETGLAGWTLTKAGGVRTGLFTLGSSFAKVGLSSRSDLQVGFTPFARLSVRAGGVTDRVSGFGDVVVRYKHRLTGDAAKVQIGVIPFVKLPTAADGLGNNKVEVGLAVPISFPLTGPVTMTLGPGLDWLADADGSGHHPAVVNLVNLAAPIAPRLTLIGELWSNFNFDPDGTAKQASADAALAYLATDRIQFDIGTNVGLTRETPDVEVYGGVSVRF